jgi:hypothetical protein
MYFDSSQCDPGKIAVNDSSTGCAPCPAGFFSDSKTSCQQCAPGSYAATPGQAQCTLCQVSRHHCLFVVTHFAPCVCICIFASRLASSSAVDSFMLLLIGGSIQPEYDANRLRNVCRRIYVRSAGPHRVFRMPGRIVLERRCVFCISLCAQAKRGLLTSSSLLFA